MTQFVEYPLTERRSSCCFNDYRPGEVTLVYLKVTF